MTLYLEFRIAVLEAFESLQNALEGLHDAMREDEMLVAWTQETCHLPLFIPNKASHRERAFKALEQLEYLENQAPREILLLPGFIGCSDKTLERARAVNLAKDAFKQCILALKKNHISLTDKSLNEALDQSFFRQSQTSLSLKKMGLARLHLKQCYRKIPILEHTPSKISWTWAHTRSIKRISVKDAEKLLLKKQNDSGIQRQLNLLSSLSQQESLAIVQELAPHLRANLLFQGNHITQERKMIKGPIPIFFPAKPQTQAPSFKPPKDKCDKDANRVIRSDARLDPTPFLPAIRAHRYLKE